MQVTAAYGYVIGNVTLSAGILSRAKSKQYFKFQSIVWIIKTKIFDILKKYLYHMNVKIIYVITMYDITI